MRGRSPIGVRPFENGSLGVVETGYRHQRCVASASVRDRKSMQPFHRRTVRSKRFKQRVLKVATLGIQTQPL